VSERITTIGIDDWNEKLADAIVLGAWESHVHRKDAEGKGRTQEREWNHYVCKCRAAEVFGRQRANESG
jgi:hypothetical protein